MKSHPEAIELDQADLESKLDQIATVMGEDVARPFRQLLRWYVYLLTLLREKKLSILRLRKMLFGAATERAADILSSAGQSAEPSEPTSALPPPAPETASAADHSESSEPDAQGTGPPRRRGAIMAGFRREYTGCASDRDPRIAVSRR